MNVKMEDVPKAVLEQIAKTPVDGSNMGLARRFLAWMKLHRMKAERLAPDCHAYTVVARVPAPTGKDASNALEIVFVVVGFSFDKAMRGSPFWPFILFACEGDHARTPIRGWTIDEYEHQINVGVTYEALEQRTYAMPGNGQPDKPKGKSK